MIDVTKHNLITIKRILEKHIPQCEVRVFGSRVTWTAKNYSDLDLVIIGQNKIEQKIMMCLKEDFEESVLSYRVDILDWHRISQEFRKNTEKEYEVIQGPQA